MVIFWSILPIIVHELAHYAMGLILKAPIKFRFVISHLWKIPIPRFVWDWPDTTDIKLKAICQAGFFVELFIALFAPLPYKIVAITHFGFYPWYCEDHNDFYGMIN